MKRLCQVLAVCTAILTIASARADSCRNTLPTEDRELTQQEVAECLEQRVKASVALHLLGERKIVWSDFGTIHQKCVGGKREELSTDPTVWAVEVTSCPEPKKTCGCNLYAEMVGGAPFRPDNPEAQSLREKNLALINRETALANQRAKQECSQIEAALKAMPPARLRRNCRSYR